MLFKIGCWIIGKEHVQHTRNVTTCLTLAVAVCSIQQWRYLSYLIYLRGQGRILQIYGLSKKRTKSLESRMA